MAVVFVVQLQWAKGLRASELVCQRVSLIFRRPVRRDEQAEGPPPIVLLLLLHRVPRPARPLQEALEAAAPPRRRGALLCAPSVLTRWILVWRFSHHCGEWAAAGNHRQRASPCGCGCERRWSPWPVKMQIRHLEGLPAPVWIRMCLG